MQRRIITFTSAALLGTVIPLGTVQSADPFVTRHCRLSPDAPARVIRIEYRTNDSPVPCELFDSDKGARRIAHANNQAGYCEGKAAKLVRELERGGYACEAANERDAASSGAGASGEPASAPTNDTSTPAEVVGDALPEIATDPSVSLDLFVDDRPTDDGRVMIASEPFAVERDAHRLDAELHMIYPNVTTRVVRSAETFDDDEAPGAVDATWRVVLGVGHDEAALAQGIAALDPSIAMRFEMSSAGSGSSIPAESNYVSPDWKRYAVAGCWAAGHRTTGALSDCAGIVVDVDTFVSCVGGGSCSPGRLAAPGGVEDVELIEALASDDPIAAARELLMDKVAGCETLVDPDDLEFAECAARAVAPPELAMLYDCHASGGTRLELLECAGGEELAEYTDLYERCTIDARTGTACVLDSFEVPVLSQASYCVGLDERNEILRCALEANVGADELSVLACLDEEADAAARAYCIAEHHLDATELAVLGCASADGDAADKGTCFARESGRLSSAQLDTVECLDEGRAEGGAALVECAGGRFLSDDIAACLEHGIEDPRCFEPTTILASVAGDEIETILGVDVRTLADGGLNTLASVAACRKKVELFRQVGTSRSRLNGLVGQLFGKPNDVKQAQLFLNSTGYGAGTPDGLMGPGTAAALGAFQSDCGLDATGNLDSETRALIGL